MTFHMLATFSSQFASSGAAVTEGRKLMQKAGSAGLVTEAPRKWHGADLSTATPEEMEAVLSETVLKEFKVRLGRIGIEYQTPLAP
jgi:hypothetical protein